MKVILLVIIGVLVFQSEDSRFFISDQLQNASELVRPDAKLTLLNCLNNGHKFRTKEII